MTGGPAAYATLYPMAPFAGLFLAPLGLCLMLGAALPRLRGPLTGAGFAAGGVSVGLAGRFVAPGLHAPSRFQMEAVALGIAIEVLGFVVLMPRVRPAGARAVLLTTCAIVAAHFLPMIPAFGPLIAALSLLAMLNATAGWHLPGLPQNLVWLIDGALKLGFGAAMIATALVV